MSEAISLYTLRYHSVSFDRFLYGCDLFRMLCIGGDLRGTGEDGPPKAWGGGDGAAYIPNIL